MSSEFAVHSDLVVHWTGAKDIEVECGTQDWHENELQPTASEEKQLEDAYLKRLESILLYGLWMTNQSAPETGLGNRLPDVACTCFTELKLSQSRHHAIKYGRLGIAFKRPFLFNRGGRPVVYYSTKQGRWTAKDRLLQACLRNLKDLRLIHYFQPMNSASRLDYDLYSESEWRIVFDEVELRSGAVVDPRDPQSGASRYFNTLPKALQERLRYLIPVDAWLALIIYPSIKIKNIAQQSGSPIRRRLEEIKNNPLDHANGVEGGNQVVEMDLDLCRHL